MNENSAIGPLAWLVGSWAGDKGMDIAPESDGSTEENPYHETIEIVEVGDLKNAGVQELGMVRYLQIVKRKSNNEVFHDQTGYFMWDKKTDVIMHSIVIPRAVCVLSSGIYRQEKSKHIYEVKTEPQSKSWGVLEQPFMAENASTKSFKLILSIEGDTLTYSQSSLLEIYGKEFDHTDDNTLTRN